jgi:hypothetical protein
MSLRPQETRGGYQASTPLAQGSTRPRSDRTAAHRTDRGSPGMGSASTGTISIRSATIATPALAGGPWSLRCAKHSARARSTKSSPEPLANLAQGAATSKGPARVSWRRTATQAPATHPLPKAGGSVCLHRATAVRRSALRPTATASGRWNVITAAVRLEGRWPTLVTKGSGSRPTHRTATEGLERDDPRGRCRVTLSCLDSSGIEA